MKQKFSEDKLPRIFFFTSLILGIIFSILIPLYQVPDEETHVKIMYNEMNMKVDILEETNNFGDTTRIVQNKDEIVNPKEYFDFDNEYSISKKYKIPSIYIIRHFPQVIGFLLGDLLNLPVLITFTIAEFLSVLAYSYIGSKTIKLMPIKKELMFTIMLLPKTIQQFSSISYDVILLITAFFYIAYIFYLKFTKEKITLLDLLGVLVLLLLLYIEKVPYVLMGLLALILPLKKLDIKLFNLKIDYDFIKKNKKKILLAIGVIIILGIIGFIRIVNSTRSEAILIVAAFIKEPVAGIKIILGTILKLGKGYILELVSGFGWLDTVSPNILSFILLCGLLFIAHVNIKDNKEEKNPFSKREKIYIMCVAIFMSIIIIMTMLGWTGLVANYEMDGNLSTYIDIIKSFPNIEGVQGRYFIPFLSLFFIPIYPKKLYSKIKNWNFKYLSIGYILIMSIGVSLVLLFRFWI